MKNPHAQALGSITSERKAIAAKENGKKGGRPRKPMEIPLTQGKVALVDREDYAELMKYKWCAKKDRKTFYATRMSPRYENGKRQTIWMHRVLMDTPVGMETDHVDGNGLNNQRSNLRICTTVENARNRSKRSDSISGHKGVHFHKDAKKWRAEIQINGKHKHIGLFQTAIAAYEAYCDACIKHHGEFANIG